jgi:hypothetical protein
VASTCTFKFTVDDEDFSPSPIGGAQGTGTSGRDRNADRTEVLAARQFSNLATVLIGRY